MPEKGMAPSSPAKVPPAGHSGGPPSAYDLIREKNIAEIEAAYREQFGRPRVRPRVKPVPRPKVQAEATRCSVRIQESLSRQGSVSLFPCDYCDLNLGSSLARWQHHRGHMKEFGCDICGKAYTTLQGRQQHVRAVHERRYRCTVCAAAMYSNWALQKHQQSSHAVQVTTPTSM